MQFGWHSHFQDRGGDITRIFDDYLAEIELAEELGFDEIWFTEHHFHPYGMLSSPNLIIATLASRTQQLTAIIDNLDRGAQTLANGADDVKTLLTNLATTSQILADNRQKAIDAIHQ